MLAARIAGRFASVYLQIRALRTSADTVAVRQCCGWRKREYSEIPACSTVS
jgi:hypothetical protein